MMSNNPSNKKDAMSKGIGTLLGKMNEEFKSNTGILKSEVVVKNTAISRVPIEDIQANPDQPRMDFNLAAIKELAASIKEHDIIQPLTVKPLLSGKYKLIAGERRLRAAKEAGLKDVPVYIREADDQKVLELALLENLQREDLNAIEVGISYKRLMDECNMTEDNVAKSMGKDRSTVSNYIRMLKLPPDIIVAVRNKTLTMGHARALINAGEVDKQLRAFNEIVAKKLSVRQTEAYVRQLNPSKKAIINSSKQNEEIKKIARIMSSHFGTKINIDHQSNDRGKITIEYYSIDELNGLLEKMKVDIH